MQNVRYKHVFDGSSLEAAGIRISLVHEHAHAGVKCFLVKGRDLGLVRSVVEPVAIVQVKEVGVRWKPKGIKDL